MYKNQSYKDKLRTFIILLVSSSIFAYTLLTIGLYSSMKPITGDIMVCVLILIWAVICAIVFIASFKN
jgi:hypothetical protein